jgi:tripartite-type tricarboxylate transporter receptor subunit TctC
MPATKRVPEDVRMTSRLSRRALLAAPLPLLAVPARAQDGYPRQPVKIVIPSAPGGPTDVMARMIQPGLNIKLGQPVLIINRPGAGGNIGVVQAGKSPPDGYTLLIASTGFVVNVSLYREPGYDAFRDFLPITELGSSPNVFLVHPSSPIRTIADLLAFAKADKNKLNVINPGQGSTPHLTVELLQIKTGVGMENIFYNGAGPSIQAILAQTTPVGITALPPAHPHIKSGALRALAVTGEKRWPDLPDVPTMQESGFPDLVSETFQGMYVPTGTPKEIVDRIARETLTVLKDPDVAAKLLGVGFDVRASGPAGLSARVAREVPMWRELIERSKIELL